MATTTSMRRITIKLKNRRKRRPKPPELFKNNTNPGTSVFGAGDSYVPIDPMAGKNWWQRHPEVQLAVAGVSAIAFLAALIYMLPKAAPEYDGDSKAKVTNVAAVERPTPLSITPGQRAAPTDASFIDTPYRKAPAASLPSPASSPAAEPPAQAVAAYTPPAAATARPVSRSMPADGASYGDGAVTFDKRKGSCNVQASAGSNFAAALVDCVNGALSGSKAP